ncbi:Hsp70 family protein, partial [Gammaproteobacteria bacterium]|nr:Hsp70 family protein [Gammaproteobacteria bacterium]
EACSYAGFSNVTFYPEPVAATLSYLHSNKSLESGNVLAFDFGGGTMDLSVIHFEGTRFKVLATEGLPLGGDHIDQLLFKEFVSPALGKGERWSRVRDGKMIESEFPFDEIEEKLLNWTVTYMLNQNQYRSNIVERINQGGPSAKKFERLLDLITNNYSYLVFQEIRKAKAAISTDDFCQIDIPELDLIIEISRREFDIIISSMLHQIETAIDNVLKKSNTEPNDIAVVVRTGGSSQIASVKTMLGEKFPDKVVEHNPFTSVAIGLAIASYHNLDFEPD